LGLAGLHESYKLKLYPPPHPKKKKTENLFDVEKETNRQRQMITRRKQKMPGPLGYEIRRQVLYKY
jgi:hypothetical protein